MESPNESLWAELPYAIAEDIRTYSSAVRQSMEDIFKDAGVAYSNALVEQVCFIAELKKLHSIVTTQYWVLQNSLSLLTRNEIASVRAGSLRIQRNSDSFLELEQIMQELNDLLRENEILELVEMPTYRDIVLRLVDGRRKG